MSACDTRLVLDASSVSGTGGRAVTFSWGLQTGLLLNSNEQAIVDLLANMSNRRITLDSQMLSFNTEYIFRLRITNYLGFSSVEYHRVFRSDARIPTIVIQSPSTLYIRSDQEVTLKADMSFSCQEHDSSSVPKMSYSWTRIDLDGPPVTLDLPSSIRRNLHIQAHTFSANSQIVLQLTAAMDDNIRLLSRSLVTLRILPPLHFAGVSFKEISTLPYTQTQLASAIFSSGMV